MYLSDVSVTESGTDRCVRAIEVEGLRKCYGERTVLEGVDFTVGRGEVFALLGPNGACKTTTVEILEGFREPTAGRVRVLGLDPARRPRRLRERVGVVLQECGFPLHLQVAELLDLWRSFYRRPRPLDELLAVVELDDQAGQIVKRLSGGQRRRLDFALALAGDPDLIFLDEPTTGFDPEARRRCWSAIANLRALGKTVLLTTHYLDEAEHLADRVAILRDGRICASGTPAELARQAGARPRLQLVEPSLEEVYLSLVGTAEGMGS
jgi:ABC-2 type transport system ATP-binding protein